MNILVKKSLNATGMLPIFPQGPSAENDDCDWIRMDKVVSIAFAFKKAKLQPRQADGGKSHQRFGLKVENGVFGVKKKCFPHKCHKSIGRTIFNLGFFP